MDPVGRDFHCIGNNRPHTELYIELAQGDWTMNTTDILELVADAIAERSGKICSRWGVCIVDGKIRCLPVKDVPKEIKIICMLTSHMLQEGLTGKEWHNVFTSMAAHMKRNPECLKPQKP